MIDLNVPIATAASANAAEQQKLIERFVRLIEREWDGQKGLQLHVGLAFKAYKVELKFSFLA